MNCCVSVLRVCGLGGSSSLASGGGDFQFKEVFAQSLHVHVASGSGGYTRYWYPVAVY